METIDAVKHLIDGEPAYKLSNANVYVSKEGYHYIDYLDIVDDVPSDLNEDALTSKEIDYIEMSLQSNKERFENHVALLKRFGVVLRGKKVLDVGCGGGLFLKKIKDEGGDVTGVELSDSRAFYARKINGLNIARRPIEDPFWAGRKSEFDIVTLWDVIEHVNYPLATLLSAASLLKKGGLLFVDTPCRDSFYHKFGVITYRISGGRFPTFLNSMYSAHKFGHKQIFSSDEIQRLFKSAGLEVVEFKKFHELSFPYIFYLRKLFKSEQVAKIVCPLVKLFLFVFPIKNKMLVVGRKESL